MPLDYPRSVTVDESIGVRLAQDADAPVISCWTRAPEVCRFWGGREVPLHEVVAKYTGRRAPEVVSYVITQVGEPVGYLQAWQIDGSFGLDMFMSAAKQRHGIGCRAARAVAVALTSRGWSPLTVDPAVDNLGALRAWGVAGFVATGESGTDDRGSTTRIMRFAP